jgi:hypothetical protein
MRSITENIRNAVESKELKNRREVNEEGKRKNRDV